MGIGGGGWYHALTLFYFVFWAVAPKHTMQTFSVNGEKRRRDADARAHTQSPKHTQSTTHTKNKTHTHKAHKSQSTQSTKHTKHTKHTHHCVVVVGDISRSRLQRRARTVRRIMRETREEYQVRVLVHAVLSREREGTESTRYRYICKKPAEQGMVLMAQGLVHS
jgi:hypothetical protein